MNNIKLINAAKWNKLTLGLYDYYSPDSQLLDLLAKEQLTGKWWSGYYHPFAVLMINRYDGKVTALRDHLGLEPFFYYYHFGKLIFASQIPQIIDQLGYIPKTNKLRQQMSLLETYLPQGIYSDETNYQDNRIEPGSLIEFKTTGLVKERFWELSPQPKTIHYHNDEDYLLRFNELLHEAIRYQLPPNDQPVAAEFSGGLDSSCVVSALLQNNVMPELFMHTAPQDSIELDDSFYAEEVIKCYNLTKVNKIGAEEFNLPQVIEECSRLFAGMPHYLFPICANNIHRAVAASGTKILFSGFGGDECVSGHAPISLALREYIRTGDYQLAQRELLAMYRYNQKPIPSRVRQLIVLIKGRLPALADQLDNLRKLPQLLNHRRHKIALDLRTSFKSLAHAEAESITGKYSHHLRMRIEDSAITAKALGFSYRYPLLYPPLVEYCHALPLHQKRYNGENRRIIRCYLAQYLPSGVYQKHQKVGGIMPATMDKIKKEFVAGKYQELFANIQPDTAADWMLKYNCKNIQAQLSQKIFRFAQQYYQMNNKE